MNKLVIICGGASLRGFDFSIIPENIPILAVNGSGLYLPRFDYWFTIDMNDPSQYEIVNNPRPGVQYYISQPESIIKTENHITYFRSIFKTELWPLSENYGEITVVNSGYGALNWAYHLGFDKIAYLGLDGHIPQYWYPDNIDYDTNRFFTHALDQLKAKNIQVVNGSLDSQITCLQRMTPENAVKWLCSDDEI